MWEHSVDMENDTAPEKSLESAPPARRRTAAKPADNAEAPAPQPRRRRAAKPADEVIVIEIDEPPVAAPREPISARVSTFFAGSIPTKAAAGVAVIAGVAGGLAGAAFGVIGNGGFGFNSVVQP